MHIYYSDTPIFWLIDYVTSKSKLSCSLYAYICSLRYQPLKLRSNFDYCGDMAVAQPIKRCFIDLWHWLYLCCCTTCNSCNMSMRDLPDMYAQSPTATGIHIRQITCAHVANNMYHFRALLVCTTVRFVLYKKRNLHCIKMLLYSNYCNSR